MGEIKDKCKDNWEWAEKRGYGLDIYMKEIIVSLLEQYSFLSDIGHIFTDGVFQYKPSLVYKKLVWMDNN